MTTKKYFLSVASIIKDEAKYLEEWLEFHLFQGVEHFYIFLNDCSDDTINICVNYARLGLLTMIAWAGRPTAGLSVQRAAYDYFIKHFGGETEWVACIDSDEFLHSRRDTIANEIRNGPYTASAYLVHWLFFGSNGHLEYSPELVIDRFTKRAQYADHHVKTILRPDAYIESVNNVHRYKVKGVTYEQFLYPVPHDQPWLNTGTEHKIALDTPIIAHFHTKSKEEYRHRCARGRADWPVAREFEPNFLAHDLNEIEDNYLKNNYSELVKEAIKGRPWKQQAQ